MALPWSPTFEKLVEVLRPDRELSYSPVFQVMFDLQEEPRWRLPLKNLEVVPEVVFSSRTSSFDLTLSVRQAENGLDAMFEYDTDLFDETSIERLASRHEQPVALGAAEADVRADLRQQDLADPLAIVRRKDMDAIVAVADPSGRRPDVAGLVRANSVCETGLPINRHRHELTFVFDCLPFDIHDPDLAFGI